MDRNRIVVTAVAGVAVVLLALYVFTSPDTGNGTVLGADTPGRTARSR